MLTNIIWKFRKLMLRACETPSVGNKPVFQISLSRLIFRIKAENVWQFCGTKFSSSFQNTNHGGEIQDRKVSLISLAPIHILHTLKTRLFQIFTITNELAAGSWYCSKRASTGSWTFGRLLTLRLMCINSPITFFLTPSWGLESFSSTGGKNLHTEAWSCSSVSALPKQRKTLSNKTGKQIFFNCIKIFV